MRYNVAQQLKEGTGALRIHKIDERFTADEEGLGSLWVTGEISLLGTNRGILVLGHLRTSVNLQCVRCLEPYPQGLDLTIEQEYKPRRDIITGALLKYDIEELDSFFINENFMLDLFEEVRQQIILAIPMKPICSDNCLGLCPECGANLNLGPCSCVTKLDQRWALLKKLQN